MSAPPVSATKASSVTFAAEIFVIVVATLCVPVVADAQSETIAEIRVHGNHTTPDADVLALSGLAPGDAADDARLRESEEKLRTSGRFAGANVRRRYRSIADPSDILVVILVEERAAVSESDLTPGPLKRLRAAGQWLPILNYADGYGLTYGARVGFADVVGDRSRVSVPLTWGGERRAAVEVERSFARGPFSLVRGVVWTSRRVNPHFDVPDLRQGGRVDVERSIASWLRVGADARVAHVDFGGDYDARHSAAGLHAIVDTRIDPSFPRNAVHARVGWERMAFPGGDAGRWLTDARGYIGVGGSAVLALRAQLSTSTDPLPAAEQALLGGGDSLRGYRAGHRAGDNLAAFSAEVRFPVNSPLNVGRFGVKTFIDTGATWASGTRLADAGFERGIGGGVYFGVAAIIVDLDVAWPERGTPRAHIGLGVSF